MTDNTNQQGCGPQPLEEVSHDTPLERLTDLAIQTHDALAACEKSATPHYWRLGQILVLARKQVPRGEWADYLKTLGIEKTRASKARAIYRAFGTLSETIGLSVSEAYERRVRAPQSKESPKPQAESVHERPTKPVALPYWIRTLADDAERLRDEVAFLSAIECQETLEAVARALDLLVELRTAIGEIASNRNSSVFWTAVRISPSSPITTL